MEAMEADDSLSRVLLAMPALIRRTNLAVLGGRLQPVTLLIIVCHGLTTVAHLAYLLLRSQGERVFNDIGTFLAAEITLSYIVTAVLQRRTLRTLHAELVDYCRDVEATTPTPDRAALAGLPRRLRRLWVLQTAFVLVTWVLYTSAPFLFEYVHGIPLGSLRRLSGMLYPTPCDLRGEACYRVMYVAVATEWFWAALSFSSIECINMVYYTVATKQFEVLAASFGKVVYHADGEPHRANVRRLLRRHQFLLRWSKDMTRVFSVPLFARLGSMAILISLPLLKMLLVDNYVLDELPLVGLYGVQTVFISCRFADELGRASVEVHGQAYTASWERGRAGPRRVLHILLLRSLAPVRTRVVWVDSLSLRTFLDVMNKSYSALQTARAVVRRADAKQGLDEG